MPELPEVETIRRQLAPLVQGRSLANVAILDPRWCLPLDPQAMAHVLHGRRVDALSRRGKYLIWELGEGANSLGATDRSFLLMHLRMTGTLLYDPPLGTPYARVVLRLDDGHALHFCDPRRFGTGELALDPDALDAFLGARLGIEPLTGELDGAALFARTRRRRTAIKALLLDQRVIAGVGNIYADEALFRAGIHPLRAAGALRRAQCDVLAASVVDALQAGLDAGGATIDDFRHADGVRGSFQHEFLVHRRRGEPCPRCGTTVVKLVAAGRGTYVCEQCQRPPRRRRR